MAYIICEPCIGTKDHGCVDVCPVDCIHPRKDEGDFEAATQLYIHPDECIDCGACVPACPVEAIFALDEVPDKWKNYIDINAKALSEVATVGAVLGPTQASWRVRLESPGPDGRLAPAARVDGWRSRAAPLAVGSGEVLMLTFRRLV